MLFTAVCQALASSATDKCLPATISCSEDGSRTCQLFQQSYSPLLSLLVALEQDESLSAKLKPKGTYPVMYLNLPAFPTVIFSPSENLNVCIASGKRASCAKLKPMG